MTACPERSDAAAYVLRALPAEEADRFRAHLATCADCRAQLAELEVAADVLPASVPQVEPPPDLKRRIMSVVEAEAELLHAAGPEADRPPPRRRVWRIAPVPALALACTLLLAGLGLGVILRDGSGEQDVRTIAAAATGRADSARAELRVAEARGTLVLSRMPAPPPGRVYQVWVLHTDGTLRGTEALFRPSADGDSTVEVPAAIDDVAKVMITDEPPGGSEAPTRPVVVEATLS
jgi:anti-sigma-K factor RskA